MAFHNFVNNCNTKMDTKSQNSNMMYRRLWWTTRGAP